MRTLLHLLLIALFAGLSYALGTALYMLDEVSGYTGICPPAPTDVPAYPCTVREFSERMVFGPWALFGHVVLGGGWLGLCVGTYAVVRALLRLTKRRSAAG